MPFPLTKSEKKPAGSVLVLEPEKEHVTWNFDHRCPCGLEGHRRQLGGTEANRGGKPQRQKDTAFHLARVRSPRQ